jgi:hypothetical protein
MSSEYVNDAQALALSIQAFEWEGKPHKSPRKIHTIEEYQEVLEEIRKQAWESYNSGAKELGWTD